MEQPTPPQAPMSPQEALRRVCFLLERGRESSYRVDAFRKASEAITLISQDELHERVEAGTLKQIKGIGDSSAAIIGQAPSLRTGLFGTSKCFRRSEER